MKDEEIIKKANVGSIGTKLTFKIESIDNPPTQDDNMGHVIAFVPLQGFQWCTYFNGSKSWQSRVTLERVEPSSWLKLIKTKKA